jgi:hypothetical protein
MSVPKATVHEDRRPMRVHNDVGATWQSADIEPISNTESTEQLPDLNFRRTSPLRNAGHYPASYLWAEGVHGLRRFLGCIGPLFRAIVSHG